MEVSVTLIDVILLILVLALAGVALMFWQRSTQNTQQGQQQLLQAQQELGRAQAEIGRAQREGEKAQREAQMLLDSAKEKGQTLLNTAQAEAKSLRDTALQEAERIRRQAEERAKAQAQEERQRLELALKNDRDALTRDQERVAADFVSVKAEREEAKRESDRLARRSEQLDARALKLDEQEEKLDVFEKLLEEREGGLASRERLIDLKLQEVAGMSQEEARSLLLGRLETELEEERALRVKASMEKARLEVKRESQKILVQAMQRQASETAASLAVSVVPIPSDAMKGRIIGREGRNIRTFESLTGVDLIIDDTPEAVLLSSFNPIRREVAKMALEQLVGDGRIHPSRIEEVVRRPRTR
jgi:ribonuclease Y